MSQKPNIFLELTREDFISVLKFVMEGGGYDLDQINDGLRDEGYARQYKDRETLIEDIQRAILIRVQ